MNDTKRFGYMVADERTILFISYNDLFPALYKIDLLENKIECLGEVPWDDSFQENLLFGKLEDTLVIAPYWHKRRFLKYDIGSATFHSVLLKQEVWENNFSLAAFSNVVQFNESLFFIGNKNGLIIEYRKTDDQFNIHNIMLPEELIKEDLYFYWNSVFLVGNILYLPIKKGGLLKVNIIDFKSDYIKATSDYQCFSMVLIDNQLWMLPYYNNNIMVFDLKSEDYSIVNFSVENKMTPFMTAVDFGREILLIPMKGEKIISVNKFNHEISEKQEFKLAKLEDKRVQRQFLTACRDKTGNSYLQKTDNRELWIFKKTGTLEKRSFSISFEDNYKIFKTSKTMERGIWRENIDTDFDSVLQFLNYHEHITYKEKNICGSKIWNSIKVSQK